MSQTPSYAAFWSTPRETIGGNIFENIDKMLDPASTRGVD